MAENILSKVLQMKKRPKKFYDLVNMRGKGISMSQKHEDYLWSAYCFARDAHRGQKRKSGEPYFEHPYQTALILSEMNMDVTTICGGLLHDVIEDTDINYDDIAEKFGEEVAKLVEGVTKISGIKFRTREEKQADNFRKMLLNVADDIRVIIIKFADRLHNMMTIDSLPKLKQRRIAIETRDIYAPLAHRFGMYKIRAELEDLILKTLDYDAYKFLAKRIKEHRSERVKYINVFTEPLKNALDKENIDCKIVGRPKHFFSIYKKMKMRNKPFEEIYDLLAIRVIVKTKEECYAVLGIVHEIFTPVMDRFKDYIAYHKANYYQSIHTTVYGKKGRIAEIQIRTEEMDKVAEEGIAAHWIYKEGENNSKSVDKYVKWLRDLIHVLKTDSLNSKDFMKTLKIDLFKDEIFLFTPRGDLIRLPAGSTPIDFAFEIHTEVGYGCIGAKADGKMIPLNTELKSGQKVEIITSDSRKPSYAWLKIVKTSKAITSIKRWIHKKQMEESIQLGQELLEKENRKNKNLKLLKTIQNNIKELGFDDKLEMLAAVGEGKLTIPTIFEKLFPKEEIEFTEENQDQKFIEIARKNVKGVKVHGISNLMVKFAQCCNPIPGDTIIGFISRGRGVIIHKSDCNNIPALVGKNERMIDVEWDVDKKQSFMTNVKIMGQERNNLLNDITKILSDSNTNIIKIEGNVDEAISHFSLVLQITNLKHLNKVLIKLKNIQGIISIERR